MLLNGSGEVLFGEGPIGKAVQEGLNELRTGIAVVDVVGVFPDIDAEQGFVCGSQRGAGSAGIDDVHRAVSLFHQPGPARTKVADSRGLKGFLELVKAAHSFSIAPSSKPPGLPPPLGVRQFQKKLWFQT